MKKALLLLCLLVDWSEAKPIVAFQSDFGHKNEAVALCQGTMLSICPDLQIIDLCHEIQPFNVRQAGLMLARSASFPKGTIFVSVVDPGVGTARKAIAIRTALEYIYIAPDNGLLSEVIRSQGVESVWRLDEKKVNPKWLPGTFDGRDLFCPSAAILARENGRFESIATAAEVEDIQILPELTAAVSEDKTRIVGHYILTDEPYGNVWTNISGENLKALGLGLGDTARVTADAHQAELPIVVSFGYVPEGAGLLYLNSMGSLALAINKGDLRREWGLAEGSEVVIEKVEKSQETNRQPR